jgi:hypothetical protein
VLVHVAFALLALMAFSAFSIDYGVFWASRRQAQNAADAGALAGAIALQQGLTDTEAETTGAGIGSVNAVWGQNPSAEGLIVTEPASWCEPPQKCIRVNVYRDGAHSNPLPMFFGALFGMVNQNMRATATATVGSGNASDCLKPFAVPDRWIDSDGSNTFTAGDTYTPPTQSSFTGYSLDDVGTVIHLKDDPGDDGVPKLNNGWYRLLCLNEGDCGKNGVQQSIAACYSATFGVNDELPEATGEKEGTRQGLLDLYELDSAAYFDNSVGVKKVVNSCANSGSCQEFEISGNGYVPEDAPYLLNSPRVIALPVFDPKIQALGGYDSQGNYHEPGSLVLVNIFGFFLIPPGLPPDEICNVYAECTAPIGKNDFKDVWGILSTKPELIESGAGHLDPNAAFVTAVYLIR